MEDDLQAVAAWDNPDEANRIAQQVMAGEASSGPSAPPVPPSLPDTSVTLPSGRTAVVRELNGLHEERLARVTDIARYKSVLLECGVESLDGRPPSPSELDDLLVGDREYLVLRIRMATYGDTVEVGYQCYSCNNIGTVDYDLTDVPVDTLESDNLSVELSGGRVAYIALATGVEEVESLRLTSKGATAAEVNTYLISQCVEDITGGALWTGPDSAKALGLRDRSTIVKFLTENQPGPRLQEVGHQCDGCGTDVPLAISLADLFRP